MRIKKRIIIFSLLGIIILGGLYTERKFHNANYRNKQAQKHIGQLIVNDEIEDGDLIFQTSLSRQSLAIQHATNSKYSHCGIIYKKGKNFFVFEAVQPVKLTPLDKWIERGKGGKFVIKRLKNAGKILTPSVLNKMKEEGEQLIGRDYDLSFEWSDDKIYCSELIWKIYKRAAGIELGKLQKLKDFNLKDHAVEKIMKERFGNNIPLDETVISPAAIFDSKLLITIKSN